MNAPFLADPRFELKTARSVQIFPRSITATAARRASMVARGRQLVAAHRRLLSLAKVGTPRRRAHGGIVERGLVELVGRGPVRCGPHELGIRPRLGGGLPGD